MASNAFRNGEGMWECEDVRSLKPLKTGYKNVPGKKSGRLSGEENRRFYT